MTKYTPLERYLARLSRAEVEMSFSDIERVIGARLPPSALKHSEWWSNGKAAHVQAKAWVDAGYRTEQVDLARKRLVFRRREREVSEETRQFQGAEKKPRRHPMFGALKGTFTLLPGTDLTEPAWPEFADYLDAKYGSAPKT